jgi:serine/threonine protein kinase
LDVNSLANGSFGVIRKGKIFICIFIYYIKNLAKEIKTEKVYAVKMISKTPPYGMPDELYRFLLKNEIEICLGLNHENVIKCEKVFEDMIAVYFIFELVEGGDLYNFIQTFNNRKIPEEKVIEIFIQILEALYYIHLEKEIVHKDIKPENFLIYNEGSKYKIKLIDFGFAERMEYPDKKLDIEAGSLPYISPEMLSHKGYDCKHDMFSIGIVLFNMLTGKQPFFGKDDEERQKAILENEPILPSEIKNNYLKDFIKGLLEKDPEKRFSVQDAKIHPWIQDYISLHEQQTVKKEFVPNISNTKNLTNLTKITNVKNIVWNNMLKNFSIAITLKLKKMLLENMNYESNTHNFQSLQGKYSMSYDIFLENVIKICEENEKLELAKKLEGK